MNILHVYPNLLAQGGRPLEARLLISALARLGHNTAAACLPPSPNENRTLPHEAVTVYELTPGPTSIADFRRVVRSFKPDIVHFTGGPRMPVQNAWALYLYATGTPYVVSGCGNLSKQTFKYRWGGKPSRWHHRLAKHAFYQFCDAPMLRHAAAVHATSRYEADIAARCGSAKVFIVPFGVQKKWVHPEPSPPNRFFTQPVTFVYLGRLSVIHKGLDLILDAFGQLAREGWGDAFRLIMAGTTEGSSMADLQQKAVDLQIPNVAFPGGLWGSDKDRLWQEGDFFLHMARYNGYALAPREALGHGLPLLTTRESDLGDWTYRYNMGVVSSLEAAALTEAVLGILQMNPQSYHTMTQNARRFAQEMSWKTVAQMFAEGYQHALAKTKETDAAPVQTKQSAPLNVS